MPQRHNHTVRSPYGGCTVALRLLWGGIRFLPCLGCLENHTADSWRPCGGLMAPLRWLYGKLVVAATTVRSLHGHLPVSLWFFISWNVRSPCGCHNICDHNYLSSQDRTIFNKANLRYLIDATSLVILLKLDSNHRFFSPSDLEIWWMTQKNNWAPLLCYFKLFAFCFFGSK